MAEKYWENKENTDGEEPIVEMLVDGDIEVIEILRDTVNGDEECMADVK